ncbi:unnamed protein product [Thlaspi arvense]|uniref:Uncharacterized protein n=1 Tax=Thlaspi arvense TaxID=13288 RepID=A0AAU9S5I5_THLAR|nr:unnamed protein product [Thlaspi arvense]
MASISRVLPTDVRLSQCSGIGTSLFPATRRAQTQTQSVSPRLFSVSNAGVSLRIQNSKPLRSVFALESASTVIHSSRSSRVACKAAADFSGDVPETAPKELSQYEKIIELLTTLFPLWVVLGTLVGIFKPSLTLKLSAPLATGLILVSCCPGGQASNVATYISKGNVALSVLMTTCSTIGAIIMTPLLTKLLAGQLVPVDAAGLAVSTFQVVLVPTIVGVLANEFFPKFTSKIITVTPLIGVILTTLLCASPIGQVAEVLKTQGAQLILPVALLHAAAFAIGYWISKFSFGESTSRTISIECGMQSSALGFLLAQKHFTNPLVAVPSAVSVVCMALGGSGLAVFWRNQPIPADDKDDFKE